MKKKTMKRVLALVLASAMSMSSIAFAAGPETKRQKTSKADSGTWKIQDWGGTSDITLQNGWIEPTENGFVLDYEKIIKDRGKEGLVLYDSKAEEYKDSILELDLTVNKGEDDTQVGFYSVALLPRFVNGANCEGMAIHDKGHLQRATYKEGNESWEWVRDSKNDFLFNQTYHLKLVTEDETLTAYAAKKGEQLKELVSFETKSGLGESGYGFRVWRGAKKVKVENIQRTEIKGTSSSLDKTEVTVPYEEWGTNSVSVGVNFAEGDNITSINDGKSDLTEGSHYSVVDNVLTISPDYFKGQMTEDVISLTIQFKNGSKATLRIIRESEANEWVFQKQGSSENVKPNDGWVTVSDGGKKVVIDYGKVVEDAGEGWVVFDGSAPQYQNSVLEYDITFTNPTQEDWIAVAPATRVKDGNNYEGFAITRDNGLERTGRKDGSENYGGIDNLLNQKFEYNKTYHLKMETVDNKITVYLTRDGKEEKLTSFESPIGLDKGSYGFRIWRGGKTITLENIKRTEIVTSKLEHSVELIEKDNWGKTDIEVPISFGEGDAVASVNVAGKALKEGSDYSVSETAFTLKKEYIASHENTFLLQVEFEKGSNSGLWVVKYNPDVQQEYTWTPDQGIDMWSSVGGNGSFELTEDGKAMRVTGTNELVNNLAPFTMNGEIEITFEALRDQDGHETGALFRADSSMGTWQAVASTDSINGEGVWDFVSDGSGKSRIVWDGTQNMSRDGVQDTKIKVRYVDDSITFWIDDQFANTGSVSKAEANMGQMGLYVDDKGDILVKKVVFREIQPMKAEEGKRETVSITNDGLSARLDKDFPRVADYTLNGKKMNGAEVRYNYVTINTVDIPAKAEIVKQDDTSVTYHVTPDQEKTGVTFDVKFTVLKDQIVEMLILNVKEPQDEKVYSIGLPNQPLISANSTQQDAKLDASYVNKNSRHFADVHETISDKNVSTVAPRSVTIPVISADGLSASMYNNVLIGGDEFIYRGFALDEEENSVGVWNTDFMYRGVDGKKMLPFPSEPDEKEMYCRIAITEDNNGDNIVNWQDGANALKKLNGAIIPGHEQSARSFFHVGYNFASGAQQPFLKVADNMKRLSNYLDGFSQQLVFKGYASEGHDSGHADYENINKRAGGAEDMRTAVAEADKINSNVGIHINSQEAYPEAKMFNEHVTGDRDGWRWMDQSKIIRRYVDMLEGGFEERLDKLYEQVPDLDFVYVDCWGEDRWGEKKLIGTLLENGCELFGNENAPDFVRFGVWTHSTSGNNNSPMHQFVYNSQKDIYPGNGIYWGGYNRAVSMMSWQHHNNINELVEQFYTNQLPQKYLMCHDVERVDGDMGYFSDNITSGNYVITKDGNKLTNGSDQIFIPWYAEDSETKNPDEAAKIYHWNGKGGSTTWTLPENWSDLGSVYLYKTTQNGKVLIEEIPLTGGQVTINAQAKTPYVLYPGEAKEDKTEWSVGSPLKDTGFNSRDFSIWKNSGNAEITFDDDGNGVSILNISGSEAGQVSQVMEGLKSGQKYRVRVFAGVENGKTARITVKQGDKENSNYLEQVVMQNQYFDNYAKGKMVQQMWVDFIAEDTTAEVILSGDACENSNGKVTFMETRIVETNEPDLERGYAANETFEYVEQGAYGIFSPEGSSDGVPHLSETHKPYTNDTISGDWSLKMYGHYGQGQPTVRTSPATMRLMPNTEYVMEFKTMGSGRVFVQSEADGNDKVLEARFENGQNNFTFTTGDKNDYIVRIESGARVLDDFKVYLKNLPVQYTVTFNSGEGSEVAAQTVDEGSLLTMPKDPTWEGYVFEGWYKDEACTEAWDFAADTVIADITLYAKWSSLVYKGNLQNLIDYAKSQQAKDDYKYLVPIVKEAFEKALAEADAVNGKADATQSEVDTAYENLLKMVHMLEFTGNSESLKVLVDAAKGLNEKLYTQDSWNVLKDALKKAEDVLADENALQKEIDAARDALQSAMDNLVKISVDKSKLQKLVDQSKKYEDAISEYTPATAEIFKGALEHARSILAKEDATQEEIDAAYAALQNVIFGLRLIPNKDKLDELIKEAESTDFSKYTVASGNALKTALAHAKAVFADENATENDVKSAEKELKTAMKGLKLVSNADKNDGKDNNGGGNGGNNNGGTSGNKADKNAPKTADYTNIGWLLAMLAASGIVFLRRRTNYK